MSDIALPTCSVQSPACGGCDGETSHDGESYYCDDCGLDYGDGDDGRTATYRDEDAEPCAVPCANTWHAPNAIKAGLSFECAPCSLPKGHTSLHWTPCKAVEVTP